MVQFKRLLCIAHLLNLFTQHILTDNNDIDNLLISTKQYFSFGKSLKIPNDFNKETNLSANKLNFNNTRWAKKLLSLVYIFENLNRFKQYLKDKAGENGEDDEEAEFLLIQLEDNVFIDKINLFLGTFDTLIKAIKHIQKENLY